MTKLGWTILTIIVLGVLAFGSMLSFGTGEHRASSVARVQAKFEAAAPSANGLVVPVAGVQQTSLVDSWGDARGGGTRAHHGIDIMAPGGTPVIAAANGTVEKLFQSNLGGTTIYVRSPRRGWIYYYAHLSGYAPGLREGAGRPRWRNDRLCRRYRRCGAGQLSPAFQHDAHWRRGRLVAGRGRQSLSPSCRKSTSGLKAAFRSFHTSTS